MTIRWTKLAAGALGALLALGGCWRTDTREARLDAAPLDASDPDAASPDAQAVDAASIDASADLSDAAVPCDDESCARLLGMPPLPRVPCGGGYAYCDVSENECSIVWYEAHECIFTAGCGPLCEPLCRTSEDCLLDDECVDGVCGGWMAMPPIGCEPPFRQCWEGYVCVPQEDPRRTTGICVEETP